MLLESTKRCSPRQFARVFQHVRQPQQVDRDHLQRIAGVARQRGEMIDDVVFLTGEGGAQGLALRDVRRQPGRRQLRRRLRAPQQMHLVTRARAQLPYQFAAHVAGAADYQTARHGSSPCFFSPRPERAGNAAG